ncbi:chorismate-binding protein [Chryseobacterium koreense]|uniref:chorismate-binding protein n=1 Tax=Chryseobacterium koreense TaxID=232216 RepID=UPI0026EEE1C1|nr:chorismate-binding protein [Chryseobacterium koreense]
MIYYRLPFSDSIFTVNENSGQQSVSFVSFDERETIDFYGKPEEISMKDFRDQPVFSDFLKTELLHFEEETSSDYQKKLEQVIQFIRQNHLPKLVISRRKLLSFEPEKINLSETFLNLCKSYPNAFVYFFIKDGKCWMGAFSELLGKFHPSTSEFETMSLAGTLANEESWSAKEIEEQKPVTDFIRNTLEKYSENVEQSATYDHISGNIKHLRTDFKAKIKPENLDEIISELHPTPAVCGIPKDFCKKAIETFEQHPRNFYAGYIKVETSESVQYFVNLRCAEFFSNAALIYVGGGITAESSTEKEWRETELKSEAILKNMSYGKRGE